MSWLLFMDESGHDHKATPFEVRGGVAIHAEKIWPFTQDWHTAIAEVFGAEFAASGRELKGSKLLAVDRMKWARRMDTLPPESRRREISRFLTKKRQGENLTTKDFAAYGQGCKLMAHKVFDLLDRHEATLFASLIPRGVREPKNFQFDHFLRKDQVFLQERFFNFLEEKQQHGLFVMDKTETQDDRRFVKRLQNYYTKTQTGISRTRWIVPTPLFVDSEMSPGVQAADICLYCINWGFRRHEWNFKGRTREEIHTEFGGRVDKLQFRGEVRNDGGIYKSHGIVHVPDPYTSRSNNQ